MPFHCPVCGADDGLRIVASLALPPDSRWDEIDLQVLECRFCEFKCLGVYEESRRGRLQTEAVNHAGYPVPLSSVRAVRRQIDRCPDPRDRRCPCAGHDRWGRTDSSGRWIGILGMGSGEPFPLRRAGGD